MFQDKKPRRNQFSKLDLLMILIFTIEMIGVSLTENLNWTNLAVTSISISSYSVDPL